MQALDDYLWLALERAKAGRMYLDAHPELADWAQRATKPIKMASTHDCLLAQLFGRFRDGAEALGLDEEATVALGFRGSTSELRSMAEFNKYYQVLTAAWETERKQRRGIP
ncbi:MAG: hypothetical protein KBD06_04780 [Candidatus Pacebacteria bacterium]|nr:hypothetical protein [Candidatus Paceibacterota bacterium]